MSIPVGRPGNVDSEGRAPDGTVRVGSVDRAGGMDYFPLRRGLRVWVESPSVQRQGSIRRSWATRLVVLDESGRIICAPYVGSAYSLAELTNDADDHGADDE